LHAALVPVSVTLPSRVRHYAKAHGQWAKTDPIDAQMLSAFGAAVRPAPTPPPTAAQTKLVELVNRRAQVVQTRVAELNRAEHYSGAFAQGQAKQLLALLDRQVEACERLIAEHLATQAELGTKAARLQIVPGVGAITAATLLAHLPELGTLTDREAAALAGLAPYNQDSGPWKGTRRIRGGRKEVRTALYMAALSAVRHDRILRLFYQRLKAAGKKPLVALTAAMRKLLLLLNRLLKHPEFELSA
jgi:transposase